MRRLCCVTSDPNLAAESRWRAPSWCRGLEVRAQLGLVFCSRFHEAQSSVGWAGPHLQLRGFSPRGCRTEVPRLAGCSVPKGHPHSLACGPASLTASCGPTPLLKGWAL